MTVSIIIPTKQRLAHANDNFVIDRATGATQVRDTVVERLAKAGKLNADQVAAAERFYSDYYNAGLAPLGAVDYGRAVVDGTPPAGHSDFRAGASERWNKACKAMSARVLKVVDRVVLREIPVEMAGRDLGIENAPQARAVGLFALTEGLDILIRQYEITT